MRTEYAFSDVVECNHAYIHCKNGSDEWSVKASEWRLKEIYAQASELAAFYRRMSDDLYIEYKKRREEIEKIKIYSDDEIKASEDWRKYGLTRQAEMIHHNEHVKEQRLRSSGFFDALDYAWKQRDKYTKLAQQAKGGLK